jgi:hypothetical protein
MTGKSLNPVGMYQMSSRTRNVECLNYYCDVIKPKEMEFDTVEKIEEKYKKMIKMNEKILSLSKSVSEDDEITIVENTYFKLFCYKEYINSIYMTDFLQHYENILKNAGFNVLDKGENSKLDKETNKEFKEMYEMITEEDFQNFLTLKYTEIDKEEDIDNMYKQLSEKYKHFSNRFQLLNFPSREEAEKYKIFLMDEYSLKNYYEFMNLVRTDEYIIKKNNEKIKNTFKIKSLSKSFNKISLISEFEKHYKISRFDLDFSKVDDKIIINENFQKLCKNIFRTEKDDFKTKEGLKKFYILMIKNMCGDLPIILSKQKGKKKIREYTINTIFFFRTYNHYEI